MNNYAFMITSAMNTKFGVYNSEERFNQTKNTIQSIKNRVPNATLIFLEMSGLPLSPQQKQEIENSVDQLIDFTGNQHVIDLYNSTDNWDVVKNVNEVTCFAQALRTLENQNKFKDCQRIFKISGRYSLNNNFKLKLYDDSRVKDKFIVAQVKSTQFHPSITDGIVKQYMSRLWSWPSSKTTEVIDMYDKMLNLMFSRLQQGGYVDIEHGLFHFLNPKHVHELLLVGIEGNIGPNGVLVNE